MFYILYSIFFVFKQISIQHSRILYTNFNWHEIHNRGEGNVFTNSIFDSPYTYRVIPSRFDTISGQEPPPKSFANGGRSHSTHVSVKASRFHPPGRGLVPFTWWRLDFWISCACKSRRSTTWKTAAREEYWAAGIIGPPRILGPPLTNAASRYLQFAISRKRKKERKDVKVKCRFSRIART